MKTLIVDDHVLIRDALRGVLHELDDDMSIVEAAGARQALRCVDAEGDIELVLLDLYLPDGSGFDVLSVLRDRFPAVSVVVLSASIDRGDITRSLELGALGFIPKSASREVMLGALRLVFSGGVYVPPEILNRSPSVPGRRTGFGRRRAASELGLTERQTDVLYLLMQGRSNKAICRVLDLAEPTVKNHVTAILKALKVGTRTQAVIAATALGLDSDDDAG